MPRPKKISNETTLPDTSGSATPDIIPAEATSVTSVPSHDDMKHALILLLKRKAAGLFDKEPTAGHVEIHFVKLAEEIINLFQ